MVALSDKSPLPSKTALRARGATSASELRRATAVKSSNCIEIQRFTYDARRRLGSCSNEANRSISGNNVHFTYANLRPVGVFDPSGLTCEAPNLTITTNPTVAGKTPFAFVGVPQDRPDGKPVAARTDWRGILTCTCDECGAKSCPCVLIVDCKVSFDFFIRVDIDTIIRNGGNQSDIIGTLGHEQRHVQNHLNWIERILKDLLYGVMLADPCSERGGSLGKIECDLRWQNIEKQLQLLILHEKSVDAEHLRPEPGAKDNYPLLPPGVGPGDASGTVPPWVK